ncbi:hypothetical protein OIV83_000675 [Microbotryomycetes sp. JL201]|nr:hypothetical protein OIV83_000675 [Microbotryomycetes sp. JL201]
MSSAANHWDVPLPAKELPVWLAVVPDVKDSKRLEIRQQHLENAKAAFKHGWMLQGGATFEAEHGSRMTGSFVLIRGESASHVKELLSKDIYTTGGAWDVEKATITAVVVANK